MHLACRELVCKTPTSGRSGKGWLHLCVPVEAGVKCSSLEMLFWAGVPAENVNVNQGETTECRWLRDRDLCKAGLLSLKAESGFMHSRPLLVAAP